MLVYNKKKSKKKKMLLASSPEHGLVMDCSLGWYDSVLHPGDTRKLKYPEIVGKIHTNAIIKWLLNFHMYSMDVGFP